jgi:hypothetical protein
MYELNLVKCESCDILFLFNLANDDVVRNNSKETNQISWLNHVKWFKNKINNKNTNIYILKRGNISIGQIRFDLINGQWIIDYSVISEERGKGYGFLLINKGIEVLKKEVFNRPLHLFGEVFKKNIGSCKVFEKSDFSCINANETIGNQLLIYKKSIL